MTLAESYINAPPLSAAAAAAEMAATKKAAK